MPHPGRNEKGQITSEGAKGNQWWKKRSSHGRKPIFANPEQLYNACMEYIEYTLNNPRWYSRDVRTTSQSTKGVSQSEVTVTELPVTTPLRKSSLLLFLDIDNTTWDSYRARPDFTNICREIEKIINTQKYEGASLGFFKESIMIRELGLKDKSEVEVKATEIKFDEDDGVV
jgi:hypothetical protein